LVPHNLAINFERVELQSNSIYFALFNNTACVPKEAATMKIISIGLAFLFILFSVSAQAQSAKVEACRSAIQEKRPCANTRLASPARSQCFRAAMQRCKANGPGAI
jgi:hypothetical protein